MTEACARPLSRLDAASGLDGGGKVRSGPRCVKIGLETLQTHELNELVRSSANPHSSPQRAINIGCGFLRLEPCGLLTRR